MGGYGGAAVAYAGHKVLILEGWVKPVLFIFLSPIVGMVLAILLTSLTSWIVRRQRPLKVDRWFRRLQLFSAALFSLGHGTNDSQKGMGIITAALVAGGLLHTTAGGTCALPVLYHGGGILFGAFGGPGPQGFAAYQHLPVIYGYLVGLAQFAGGLAILLGAFGRIGSVCVIIVMIGAINRVHRPHGFDIGKDGMEFPLTVLLVALGLLLTGPVSYSIGRILPGPLKRL